MAIYEYEHFHYAGYDSEDFGAIQASVNSGLFEETVVSNVNIIESRIRGQAKSYLHSVDQDPIEFELNVFFNEEYSDDDIDNAKKWLSQRTYQPFYVIGSSKRKIIYCMPTGEIKLSHNGAGQGYLTVTMHSNSYHMYSPVNSTQTYDLSSNPSAGTVINLGNSGDIGMKPTITIQTTVAGDIRIVNESNSNDELKFIGLANAETIVIDCEREDIQTDLPSTYRYGNSNLNFLELPKGLNKLRVYGKCKISFKYEYIYIA